LLEARHFCLACAIASLRAVYISPLGKSGLVHARMTEGMALPKLLTADADLVGMAIYNATEQRRQTHSARVCPRPNAESVMRQLPSWIAHYNEVRPQKALGYRSPREYIAAHERP
jgi:hypothetical protein